MSDRHVADELTAYLHNELSEGDRARVTEHLARCAECRDAYSETRTGSELAMRLPQVAAPEDLWEGIERRLDRGRADGDRLWPVPLQRPVPARWPLAAAAALLLLAGAWFGTRGRLDFRTPEGGSATDGWHVRRVAGAPVVGGAPLAGAHGEEAELRIGGELVTDAASRAALTVADIGHLTVEPGTRLRLVASGRNEHRVALDRGTIEAVVIAPPRLFLVETPSALAVDLGCAYTLTVDDDGAARLSVTAGWVALENGVHDALVPAGAECTTRPGAGPGLPVWRSAAPGFRAAAAASSAVSSRSPGPGCTTR